LEWIGFGVSVTVLVFIFLAEDSSEMEFSLKKRKGGAALFFSGRASSARSQPFKWAVLLAPISLHGDLGCRGNDSWVDWCVDRRDVPVFPLLFQKEKKTGHHTKSLHLIFEKNFPIFLISFEHFL